MTYFFSLSPQYSLQQGSRIRSVRILFFERYVRTLTYSILAYVNKNRIRARQCIRTTDWVDATTHYRLQIGLAPLLLSSVDSYMTTGCYWQSTVADPAFVQHSDYIWRSVIGL